MAKKQEAPKININGQDYTEADLTQEQLILVNHVMDLDRKINGMMFQLDQLNVGKQAFMAQLEVSLKQAEKETENA